MPLYFFSVFDGVDDVDRKGTELANPRAAQIEAISRAGTILKSDAERLAVGEDWYMEVTDHRGLILFRLDFFVLQSTALTHAYATRGH